MEVELVAVGVVALLVAVHLRHPSVLVSPWPLAVLQEQVP